MLERRAAAYLMGMVLAGLVLGWFAARPGDLLGHRTTPITTADLVFRSFDLPEPTAMPVDHDYAVALGRTAPAPTASPKPVSSARPKATPAAGHTARGSGVRTTPKRRAHHNLSGKASWYATGKNGFYAAACGPLRRAMGPGWRGRHVLVAYRRRAVEVVLNDWCGSKDKTIDLSDEAFSALGRLSQGVLRVTVGW